MGRSITLMCKASGLGTLAYSWERSSGRRWTTVSNDNTTSYTTDTTLAIGEYKYRCRVSNEAGPVVSNKATVNVYGEYCPSRQHVMILYIHRSSHYYNSSYQSVDNCWYECYSEL